MTTVGRSSRVGVPASFGGRPTRDCVQSPLLGSVTSPAAFGTVSPEAAELVRELARDKVLGATHPAVDDNEGRARLRRHG
jgi:hypothetical protein